LVRMSNIAEFNNRIILMVFIEKIELKTISIKPIWYKGG